MNEQMMKSLIDLIDESLAEIEELKKSDRFSASEIKIEGPGSGIAGKEPNGKLGKEEDEDDDDDDDEKDEKDEAEKAEGKNREADPNGGSHQPVAKEEDAEKSDCSTGMPAGTVAKEEAEKAEGKNREADPNGGSHQPVAKSETEEDEAARLKREYMEKCEREYEESLKKSAAEKSEKTEQLLKSYVDERISPIEGKLEAIAKMVKEIADTPVATKGVSYKDVTPLKKSDDDAEPLVKAEVADKLFELKKSGTFVDSADIAAVETGSPQQLAKIVEKYKIS